MISSFYKLHKLTWMCNLLYHCHFTYDMGKTVVAIVQSTNSSVSSLLTFINCNSDNYLAQGGKKYMVYHQGNILIHRILCIILTKSIMLLVLPGFICYINIIQIPIQLSNIKSVILYCLLIAFTHVLHQSSDLICPQMRQKHTQ